MKQPLLITTAIGLMLGTGAWAQSPSEKSNRPPAAQTQTNPNSSASQSAPSSSASTPSANPAPSTNAQSTSPGSREGTTTGQPNATGGNDTTRTQAQSNQPSQPSRSDNNTTTAPSQAQSAQQPSSSSQAQTNTAPPANNQNQPATNSANNANPGGNTAAGNQPANTQGTTAQSSSTNVNVSANLNDNQRTRFSESITRLNAKPVNNVNFSLSVGTVVPRDIQFQPLPAEVVEIVPQYRGYNFFVAREDIVIVEPSTYKIVDVLPRSGRSTAQAPASQPTAAAAPSRKTTFSDSDREVIRKHARSSRTEERPVRTEERSTTGSATTSTRVRVGDRLPDSVEVRSFPDEAYRESPTLREYRYIERDNRTYVVEPRERTIIEEIE
jgi:hypothetical protein